MIENILNNRSIIIGSKQNKKNSEKAYYSEKQSIPNQNVVLNLIQNRMGERLCDPESSSGRRRLIVTQDYPKDFASKKDLTFKANGHALVDGLKTKHTVLDKFIKSQENLSDTRFIQDVATNWVPKVIFTRSLADFTEMSFLEFTESALFYYAPVLLGGVLHKAINAITPQHSKKAVSENLNRSTAEILADSKLAQSGITKRVLPVKAAVVLACVSIPAAEYALSFAKNLLTLNLFKKSNFDNIVNLNKKHAQVEDKEQQEKVRKSANKHIANATKVSLASLAGGAVLATVGHKSELLQKVSKGILRPGQVISDVLGHLGVKSEKATKALNTYINFDFDTSKGKLGLSKGQLVVSTVTGFFGYSAAGKDRGKLDQLEVWTRVPFVVFYTIFGSALFDHAFKHILEKKNKFSDLVKKDKDGKINIPTRAELPEIAKKIANVKKTNVDVEFNRLVKEKAIITAIPYGFSLLFMGVLLAGITRFWTQFRFNRAKKEAQGTENGQKRELKTEPKTVEQLKTQKN